MSAVEERLEALGLTVPEVPAPVAVYVPAVVSGDLVFTSGQLPMKNGELMLTGKVGGEVSPEEAVACAQQCGLNAIAAEQNRNLTATMASFRRAASAVDSAAIDSTLKNFRASSTSLTRIATNLDSTTKRVNGLVGGIERGEGTVGKFMKDTLLYRDLRGLVTQADSVLADLKANPRKYINLRIF